MSVAPGWSLQRRLSVGIAVISGLLVVIMAAAVVVLLQTRSDQRLVTNRYFSAIETANNRFADQLNAEAAIRGYALTDNPATLQPLRFYDSSAYRSQVGDLTGLLGSDPASVRALDAWDTAAQRWYTAWAAPTLRLVHQRGRDALGNNAVLYGKRLFDANRVAFQTFSDGLSSSRQNAEQALTTRTDLLFGVVLLLVLGAVLAIVAVTTALQRWILTPLGALGRETQLVQGGALEHKVGVEGPSEVRDVADQVDAMRREIVLQLGEVEAARVEIETARVSLESQAESLARSNRDLEQFAYVASHDLQEPLRKVASFCQMLERRYAGQLDERADQYIAYAVDGAKRMQQLINDLLQFSRVGRSQAALVTVETDACLDAARRNTASALEESGGVVEHASLPVVLGDTGLITQLFANLLTNALKFRGDSPPVVRFDAQPTGPMWTFSCSDNGIGVEPQYADRIFVIFQRLHGKDEYAGTGIGLALCRRIVEHHGGEIWLDADYDGGARFCWTLPAVIDDVDSADAGAPVPTPIVVE